MDRTADGRDVRRLTTHDGDEYFPAFSPDGKLIAFTGEYDGNSDVYVIPAAGGEPQRLTWHPGTDEVVGWWPDGSKVIFRSQRNDPTARPGTSSRCRRRAAIRRSCRWAGRRASTSIPTTGMWAFNRKPRARRATWKRYRGGTAPNIWVGDPKQADFKQITDFAGDGPFPMWHGGRIYFLSDQGGTANIWSIKPDGTDRKQLHRLRATGTPAGRRWAPDGRIVFTLAADI